MQALHRVDDTEDKNVPSEKQIRDLRDKRNQ